MATQSLRGLANHGAMHWRGDRRGGLDSEEHLQPDTGAFDERAAFNAFNIAFAGLNGRAGVLPEEEMAGFTDFALQLTYPPNPNRDLDDSLDAGQRRARSRYFGCEVSDESMAVGECVDGRNLLVCHREKGDVLVLIATKTGYSMVWIFCRGEIDTLALSGVATICVGGAGATGLSIRDWHRQSLKFYHSVVRH